MTSLPLCSKCATPVPVENLNAPDLRPCPGCASEIRVEVFPAFFRETATGSAGEALVVDTEASCFYHANKRAATVCGSCGRFLCALCDVELDGAHYCPDCLHTAQQKGKIEALDNSRKLYDVMALHLAALGILILYFSILCAPLAMFIAIKHRKAPISLVARSRWRFAAARVLAGLQIIGWIALAGFLLSRVL